MTNILVVDDHPANRDLMATLLRYRGHHIVEAADGDEGLASARQERPALIISDILMPSMDGFEFVRRLRLDPSLRDITVIFSSAYYLGREAAELAKACGVETILPKPIEPEAFLAAIERTLSGRAPEEVPACVPAPAFDDAHRRLMTDQLAATTDALQASNQRLGDLVQVGLRLGAATDPVELLQDASQAVRRLAGARFGFATAVGSDKSVVTAHAVAGVAKEKAFFGGTKIPPETVCAEIIGSGNVVRLDQVRSPANDQGLPDFVDNFLGAPLGTPTRTNGVIGVVNKIGTAFTVEDESIARAVGAQAGRALENMTLVRELEERTRELNRVSEAKTRLLACASHDLRQPLQALRLFIDVLGSLAKDERIASIAANASTALSGAENLTNALFEMSRFDTGEMSVHPEAFPVSRIFDRLAVECAPLAERKGLSLRIDDTDIVLHSDAVLLQRAIRNLVCNAIRYTDRGEVFIRCRMRGSSEVAIQVWDSGRGIAADHRKAIFEDFYSVEGGQGGAQKEGLGLGLAIVARMAELLNGRVTVHSRFGRGSVFSFILPVGATEAAVFRSEVGEIEQDSIFNQQH